MNKVVNERRGAIFDEAEALSPTAIGELSGRSGSKKPAANSLFGVRSPTKKWFISRDIISLWDQLKEVN